MKRSVVILGVLLLAVFICAPAFADNAKIAGNWKVKARTGDRTQDYMMEIQQEGEALRGKLIAPDGQSVTFSKCTFSDNVLKFAFNVDEGAYQVEGKLEGDRLSGTYTAPSARKDTWEATRAGGGSAGSAADIIGTWKSRARAGEGTTEYILSFKQDGDTLTGTLTLPDGQVMPMAKVTFSDNTLRFTVASGEGNYEAEGKLEGNKLRGSYTNPGGAKNNWEATKS